MVEVGRSSERGSNWVAEPAAAVAEVELVERQTHRRDGAGRAVVVPWIEMRGCGLVAPAVESIS